MTLLEKVAEFSNLESSFKACMQGKRGKLSPQLAFLKWDACLEKIQNNILLGKDYPWGPYKEFYVCDPKRRVVSSAPFLDRIAHRAIYQVVDPLVDQHLIPNTFACRKGKGNGRAIVALHEILKSMDEYWVVKMDVRKYFSSITHGRLLGKLLRILPDDSLEGLFRSLLQSHPNCRHGVGLPLGNLTSQVFANFYLHQIDKFLMEECGGRYVRYMDDMVLVLDSREKSRRMMKAVVALGKKEKLKFPQRKRVCLRSSGVPFLGFLVDKESAKPLNRNRRRVKRKLREKEKKGLRPSELERSILSYKAWEAYPLKLIQT